LENGPKRTLNAVKLAYANAQFERAADRLTFWTVPLYAQAQQQSDAQKVISSIIGDKAKIVAYCEVTTLGGQAVEAAQEKNEKKADALMHSPEHPALFNATF